MSIKNRLLAVQGPQQLIAGVIAMEWYASTRGESRQYRTVLMMYDFLMAEHLEQDFVNVIGELSRSVNLDKTVFVSGAEMRKIMKGSYAGAKGKLRQLLGESHFDEIHIGRDFCGDGSPLVLNAYPDSERILYGDSFGLVGNEAVCDNFDWRRPVRSAASGCKKFLKDTIFGTHKKLDFHAAVLTLPLDWSGTYLDDLPLLVPNREFVISKIEAFSRHLHELNAYADALLADADKSFLFLLSNLSASGYMSDDAEVELYVETVRKLAPTDARIVLKAHPRAPEQILNAVVARLAGAYPHIQVIDNVNLSRYPVELWVKLLQSCTIVPVFSTSAINLKYFYDKSVVLPLTDASMERYCYPEKLGAFAKGYRVISQSVANLRDWDGQSVLWKGNQ